MSDYIVEIKIRDKRSNKLLDESKIINGKGWVWLIDKYGLDLLKLELNDLVKLNTFEELVEYVKSKQEKE